MMAVFLRLAVALPWAVMAAACATTYAPPLHTSHGGAPGRLDAGQMEVSGTSVGRGVIPAGMGSGGLGYAARPHLTVEGGVDGSRGWTLGWGGVRVPYRWRTATPWLGFAVDGSLSAGLGVGGKTCDAPPRYSRESTNCNDDGRQWYRRLAGGGAMGAGAAMRLGPVSLFSRGMLQITHAQNIAPTHWASGVGGVHVHILDRADLWLSMGVAHYANQYDSNWSAISELGLAFRFDPVLGWR